MAAFAKAVFLPVNPGLKGFTSFHRHKCIRSQPPGKPRWGEERVGLGHSPSQTEPYVMFFLPEADTDAHNMRQEMGQVRIQATLKDPRRWKPHELGWARRGTMTGWHMGG